MSDIDLVVYASEAGRQLLEVFPAWGVSRASLAQLPWAEAFQRYAEVAAAHDYWWPLVRGGDSQDDYIVIEDTQGMTTARLALFARTVTAVFVRAEDARWLRDVQSIHANVRIVVHPKPSQWLSENAEAADVVVWQRPSRHLQALSVTQRRAAFESFRRAMRADGTLIVDDNLCEPWWARLLSNKDAAAQDFGLLKLRTLKSMVPQGEAFVGIRPLRRWNWPAAELKHRDSRRSVAAFFEGRLRHSMGLRELRRYVVPRKALVLKPRRQALLAKALTHDSVRRELRGAQAEVRKIFAGTGEVTIALVGAHGSKEARVAMRFGYRSCAVARLERGKAALERFACTPLAPLVPRLLCADASAPGGAYTAESFLEGLAISDLPEGARRDVAFERAARTLDAFVGRQVEREMVDEVTYQRLVGDAIDLIASSTSLDQRAALERVSARMRAAFVGKPWPLHLVHGDFKAGNVLVDRSGAVTGVIDWDMWEEKGLPLQDLLVLFAYDWSKASGIAFGPRLLPDLLAGTWRPIYERILAERAKSLGLSAAEIQVLRAVFWLRNVQDRLPPLFFVNREGEQGWIDEPLRLIDAALSQ